jgi:hypothetical protein
LYVGVHWQVEKGGEVTAEFDADRAAALARGDEDRHRPGYVTC